MQLTGDVFLGLVLGVTAAAFAGTVVLWPRLAGRTPGRVLARVGMLLGVNALVLLTAATQLNAQFLFFADWTDLRGALTGTVTSTAMSRGVSASQAASHAVAGVAATAPATLPPLPVASTLGTPDLTYTIHGPLSGISGTVLVQLPPGYTSPAHARTRYPVIETFHGWPGNPDAWVGPMDLGGVMAAEVATHHMRSALVVSPQMLVPPGADTECVNGRPGYPQLETWLTRDVPAWVARTFRVRTDRASWATIGLSTGGWCAAMATMLHPAQYSAAIVMGGYFRPEFGPAYDPYPPGSRLSSHYDLVALARRRPPPVAIWLETSHSDPVSYTSSAELLKEIRSPMSVDAVVLQHAGHRLSLWQGLLPGALSWLGRNVPGFAPTG